MGISAELTKDTSEMFAKLVFPFSVSEFLDHTWGQRFVHIQGDRAKFGELFSWSDVNTALERCVHGPAVIRVLRGGKDINPERYFGSERLPSGQIVKLVRTAELMHEIRQGATLILHCGDRMSPNLGLLCQELENALRNRVTATVHAVFDSGYSNPAVCATDDMLALQIIGRRKWELFEPGQGPLRMDETRSRRSSNSPAWQGILEQGECLHVPRGWWYVTYASDEPVLEVDISAASSTGLDLLHWCADTMKGSQSVAMNIPLFESQEAQNRYSEILKTELVSALSASALGKFCAQRKASLVPRSDCHLPDSATVLGRALSDDDPVRLLLTQPLAMTDGIDMRSVSFEFNGKAWRCPAFLKPVLTVLNDTREHTIRELLTVANDPTQRSAAKNFIHQLVQVGILVAAAPEAEQHRS